MRKAKTEIKFIDSWDNKGFIKALYEKDEETDPTLADPNIIYINGFCPGNESDFAIVLDIPTAIKFSKSLSNEIRKSKTVKKDVSNAQGYIDSNYGKNKIRDNKENHEYYLNIIQGLMISHRNLEEMFNDLKSKNNG